MKKIYALGDVTCSHCAQVMETKMSAIPGVTSAMISFKLVDCLEKCLIYGHIRRFAN